MQTWTLAKRPQSMAEMPSDLISVTDWTTAGQYSFAQIRALFECQGGLPGTLRFIVPSLEETVYLDEKDDHAYTHWMSIITSRPADDKIIAVTIDNDGEGITLTKMTIAEHLENSPSVARIAEIFKLYHHHVT